MKILAQQVLKTQVLMRRVLLYLNAWNRLNFGRSNLRVLEASSDPCPAASSSKDLKIALTSFSCQESLPFELI